MNKYLGSFRNLFSKTPNYIIFFATAHCNARCEMCFYWKEIDQAAIDRELSLDEIEKISRSFGQLEYITLTGGEPTLRNDLPEIARIFDKNNKVQFISIPTNSILVDKIENMVEEVLKTTKYPYLKLCLSLDGLGKDHDQIRGVDGCFDKVVANYRNLVELKKQVKDFEILVNMTISAKNHKRVGKVMNFVRKEMPLADFNFSWARGNVREVGTQDLSDEDYHQIADTVNKEKKNFSSGFTFARLMAANKKATREIIERFLRTGKRKHVCSAGKKMIVISETGLVRPCEILNTDFGNLRDFDYNIKKVLSTEKAKRTLEYIKDKKCACTFENAIQNSLVSCPSNWPVLIKKLIGL